MRSGEPSLTLRRTRSSAERRRRRRRPGDIWTPRPTEPTGAQDAAPTSSTRQPGSNRAPVGQASPSQRSLTVWSAAGTDFAPRWSVVAAAATSATSSATGHARAYSAPASTRRRSSCTRPTIRPARLDSGCTVRGAVPRDHDTRESRCTAAPVAEPPAAGWALRNALCPSRILATRRRPGTGPSPRLLGDRVQGHRPRRRLRRGTYSQRRRSARASNGPAPI